MHMHVQSVLADCTPPSRRVVLKDGEYEGQVGYDEEGRSQPHGMGTMHYTNGDEYVGGWRRGEAPPSVIDVSGRSIGLPSSRIWKVQKDQGHMPT